MIAFRPETLMAPAALTLAMAPHPAAAGDLSCQSAEGQAAILLSDYNGKSPVISVEGARTALETLTGGSNPTYQGTRENGDLVTFMFDTKTGRYGYNLIGPDGIIAMDSGSCGEAH